MNYQDLFSLKKKKKKKNLECRLLQILLGALRVKVYNKNCDVMGLKIGKTHL